MIDAMNVLSATLCQFCVSGSKYKPLSVSSYVVIFALIIYRYVIYMTNPDYIDEIIRFAY